MGVVNATPDSFSGGVRDPAEAAALALQLEAEGADMIDIGGESTRPSAEPVSEAEERARVIPVVRAVARRLRVPISIDTYKATVAEAALDCGAVVVNDISGLGYDAALGRVCARARAGLVLMHTRGRSRDMYREAHYADVTSEVGAELMAAVTRALDAGVDPDRIMLDPGLGFAKRAEHCYTLIRCLPVLSELGYPLLVGPSRKSFLVEALGSVPARERDWGTAAAVTAAVLGGAHMVRVHAVAPMVQVVRVADAIRRFSAG